MERDDDFTGGTHGAVPEPGVRGAGTLGAATGCAARELLDVRRAAAHRAAAAAAAVSHTSAGHGKLPAAIDGARTLNFAGGRGGEDEILKLPASQGAC